MEIEHGIFVFFIFAFTGWLIELGFRSVYERKPVNPGFHKGPWLPIYGFCGVVIFLGAGLLSGYSIVIRMLFYFVLCTSVEYIAGFFLEKVFNRRYWDYTHNRLNIRGYICPKYSACWVLICITAEYFILRRLLLITASVPGILLSRIDIVLLGLLTIDFFFSSGLLNRRQFRYIWKLLGR